MSRKLFWRRSLLMAGVVACWSSMSVGELASQRWGSPPSGQTGAGPGQKGAVEVIPTGEGMDIVKFDLAGLKGAKVCRADLLIFRSANIDGASDDAQTDIEAYPLFEETPGTGTNFAKDAKLEPVPKGKPLAIRGPWFDRIDATEAVKAWVGGKANGGFFFKACPNLLAGNTCLDVYYEVEKTGDSPQFRNGKDAKLGTVPPPAQVTGVKVAHRNGQTFIIWKEIDDPVGRDEIMWGDLKAIIDGLDKPHQTRYCVFRSDKPITADTLSSAELIAQVKPLSGWNLNGRNIEKPIDHIIATQYAMIWGHWNPFGPASQDGDFGKECLMERLAIKDGDKPLDRGTGLYVHTGGGGKAYYAVASMVDGVINNQLSDKNVSEAVDEAKAVPEPVLQKIFPKLPYFNYPETRYHFVTYVSTDFANVPYQYYNWSVAVPEKSSKVEDRSSKSEENRGQAPVFANSNSAKTGASPLELNLGLDGRSYQRTPYRLEPDSIVLVPHDFPLNTWWYGYHESYGTLKSFKQGVVQPYTERRVLAFVEWAAKKYGADRNRIVVTARNRSGGGGPSGWGGVTSGCLHLGVMHPDIFTACFPGAKADPDYSAAPAPTQLAIWGKPEWACKNDAGKNVWEALNLNKLLADLPASVELPLVSLTGSKAPKPVLEFGALMLDKGYAFIANFNEWGGPKIIPVTANGTWPPPMIRGYVARNVVLPCFGRNLASSIRAAETPPAKPFMLPNNGYRWQSDDIVDTPAKLEISVWREGREAEVTDLTLRRIQNFKVTPGKTYHWQSAGAPPPPAARPGKEVSAGLAEGDVTVDKDGVLTLKDVRIGDKPTRITVTPK